MRRQFFQGHQQRPAGTFSGHLGSWIRMWGALFSGSLGLVTYREPVLFALRRRGPVTAPPAATPSPTVQVPHFRHRSFDVDVMTRPVHKGHWQCACVPHAATHLGIYRPPAASCLQVPPSHRVFAEVWAACGWAAVPVHGRAACGRVCGPQGRGQWPVPSALHLQGCGNSRPSLRWHLGRCQSRCTSGRPFSAGRGPLTSVGADLRSAAGSSVPPAFSSPEANFSPRAGVF